MEFHFVRPKLSRDRDQDDLSKVNFRRIKQFLPLFVLAAFLPFLIGFVLVPPKLDFLTRADSASDLRIWIEPSNIVAAKNSTIELTVMAQFDDEGKLIPEISFDLESSGPVALNSNSLSKSIPFSGKAELGKILVTTDTAGTAVVSVVKDSIKITAATSPIKVSTSGANITVR